MKKIKFLNQIISLLVIITFIGIGNVYPAPEVLKSTLRVPVDKTVEKRMEKMLDRPMPSSSTASPVAIDPEIITSNWASLKMLTYHLQFSEEELHQQASFRKIYLVLDNQGAIEDIQASRPKKESFVVVRVGINNIITIEEDAHPNVTATVNNWNAMQIGQSGKTSRGAADNTGNTKPGRSPEDALMVIALPDWWNSKSMNDVMQRLSNISTIKNIAGPATVTIRTKVRCDTNNRGRSIARKIDVYSIDIAYKLLGGTTESSKISDHQEGGKGYHSWDPIVKSFVERVLYYKGKKLSNNRNVAGAKFVFTIPKGSSSEQVEKILLKVAGIKVENAIGLIKLSHTARYPDYRSLPRQDTNYDPIENNMKKLYELRNALADDPDPSAIVNELLSLYIDIVDNGHEFVGRDIITPYLVPLLHYLSDEFAKKEIVIKLDEKYIKWLKYWAVMGDAYSTESGGVVLEGSDNKEFRVTGKNLLAISDAKPSRGAADMLNKKSLDSSL